MKQAEILQELRSLTTKEQIEIVEDALKLIKKNFQGKTKTDNIKLKQQLKKAADALLPDYVMGGELTIFTSLDSEEFHEAG